MAENLDKLRVVVAAHKPYWMPDDPVYLPVQVGAAGKASLGFQRDDEGESISVKNPGYCELTGLYWAWKNLDAAWLGLVHYRRYFQGKRTGERRERVASGQELAMRLEQTPIILPKPRHYVVETTYSQYVHAHHEADLATTRAILAEQHPSYLDAYDASMQRRSGHRFNMFVMRRDLADAYCAWLFGILTALEERLDTSSYSAYDARVYGFVAERLLDPWIATNHLSYTEMGVVNLESEHWLRKGTSFLMRKFRGSTHAVGEVR